MFLCAEGEGNSDGSKGEVCRILRGLICARMCRRPLLLWLFAFLAFPLFLQDACQLAGAVQRVVGARGAIDAYLQGAVLTAKYRNSPHNSFWNAFPMAVVR